MPRLAKTLNALRSFYCFLVAEALLLLLLSSPSSIFVYNQVNLFVRGFQQPSHLISSRPAVGQRTQRYHHLVRFAMSRSGSRGIDNRMVGVPHVENVLFVECGFGNDSHGQNPTKAAVRACRNAIEFNSIPSIQRLVPNGYDDLKLDVILAVPPKYQSKLNIEECAKVFPYGSIRFQIQDGGMIAPSGIAIDRLGDTNDDMIVVCCSVTVGY